MSCNICGKDYCGKKKYCYYCGNKRKIQFINIDENFNDSQTKLNNHKFFQFKRVSGDLGIKPNRFYIKKTGRYIKVHSLYYNEKKNIPEDIQKKLIQIMDNVIEVQKENFEWLVPDLEKEKNDLIIKFNNTTPFWIPLGYLGCIMINDSTLKIDRADSHLLPRGYGNVMLCFLLQYLKIKYPEQKIDITLDAVQEAIPAYLKWGLKKDFKSIEFGSTKKMDLNLDEAEKRCEEISEKHDYVFYYYENES